MARGRKAEVKDDDIVSTLRDWPRDGVFPSTSTVRDEIEEQYGEDYNRKTLYRRLDSLESEGRIDKIQVGQGRGKSIGWYVGPQVDTTEPETPDGDRGHQQPQDRPEPDTTQDESTVAETTGLLSRLFSSDGERMDLPTVFILVFLAWTAGWAVYKAYVLQQRGRKAVIGKGLPVSLSVDRGLLTLFGSVVGAFVSFGAIGWMALQALGMVGDGLIGAAVGYLCGVALVVALLLKFGSNVRKRANADMESAGENA